LLLSLLRRGCCRDVTPLWNLLPGHSAREAGLIGRSAQRCKVDSLLCQVESRHDRALNAGGGRPLEAVSRAAPNLTTADGTIDTFFAHVADLHGRGVIVMRFARRMRSNNN